MHNEDFGSPAHIASAVLASLVFLAVWWRRSRSGHPLPPGPSPIPLLGNIGDFTLKELWLTATKWARLYGDVVHLSVPGQHIVFLNSPEAASELLDKRGAIYSDKPILQMTNLSGVGGLIPFCQYNDTFRRQRKYMQQTLGPRSIPAYHPIIQTETTVFLNALLGAPSNYLADIRKYAGSLTLAVVYGLLSTISNEIASGSGVWAVDIFPPLRHLPSWFPGAGFKRKAAAWETKMTAFIREPFEWAKDAARKGTILPSFCSQFLGNDELDPVMENDLLYSANSMYAASADTTIASISQFILAMVQHPHVMKKAQAEIDSVIGPHRLPTFSDRESLPYVEAVMSEVWRWGPPVPLNLPHTNTQDDVYRNMYIPKNTMVIANIWDIMHDEQLFPDPDVFDPGRYFNVEDVNLMKRRDPRNYIFGFGRRRCPGADLVESSIWLLIVSTLAALDIKKKTRDNGEVVEPQVSYSNSIFRVPDKFEFDVQIRSPQAWDLIRENSGIH